MNGAKEWPDLLAEANAWELSEDAVGGSGYLAPGLGEPIPVRLGRDLGRSPDVVILAAGRNDLKYPANEVASAATLVVDRLRAAMPDAEIVLFSPFSSGEPTAAVSALTADLSAVADRARVEWVDVSTFSPSGLIGSDGVHPTQAGHEALAARIAEALTNLDLGIGVVEVP
jgi:lysophospholipase L1-like esterase